MDAIQRTGSDMAVIDEIAAERARQIEAEGWSADHDDAHPHGEMALAAAAYAFTGHEGAKPWFWPWSAHWWKATTHRRNLIKAAALIVAEIDRMDRLDAKGRRGQQLLDRRKLYVK